MTKYYRLRIYCPDGTVAEKEYADKTVAETDWAVVASTGAHAVVEEFEEEDGYEPGSSLYSRDE